MDSGARVVGALLEVLGAHCGMAPARGVAEDVLEAALQLAAMGERADGLSVCWVYWWAGQNGLDYCIVRAGEFYCV